MRDIRLKRAYDPTAPDDGARILVDRLWPRGLSKAEARIDQWLRDLAPSPELRRWFGHDVTRWAEFRRRYRQELQAHAAEVASLRRRADQGRVTLLFAARDSEHNNAVVLREFLLERSGGGD